VRTYERNGNSITIKPGHDGCATIFDKDVWIYCISQLMEAINRGRGDVSRTVRFTAYDFLVATNRDTSGRAYERMGEALERLSGTRIETNIATDGYRERGFFGLIDAGRIVENKETGKAVAVEVTLSDWLFRSVKAKNVLTLSPDYFRIRKPIDRRIYELARKHCGTQKSWQCSVKVLHEKCGSTSTLKEFRRSVKTLVDSDDLPDYSVSLDGDTDVVTFSRR
jgi:plasmid replication initiation protein